MLKKDVEDQFDDTFISYDSDHHIWIFTGKKQFTIPDRSFIDAHADMGQRELFLAACWEGKVEEIKK